MKNIIIPVALGLSIFWYACSSKKSAVTSSANSTPAKTTTANLVAKVDAPVGLNLGNKAPEIVINNPDGKSIKLSSLQGKLVLIDFWASWCGPCRAENPNLVATYNKYHPLNFKSGSGFEIFSVSLDQSLGAWKNAINRDQLIWENHGCDFFRWQSPIGQLYGINGIPANFLINKDGIIIARDLMGPELDKALALQVLK